jgi:hypothetical protein
MLTPEDVCKTVQHDLTVYVNAAIRNNAKMLWRGETLSIDMDCEADLKWAMKALSQYNVSVATFQTPCEHKCDDDCRSDDDGGCWSQWNDGAGWSSCIHFQEQCDCGENRFVVSIKLNKD